MKPAVRPDFDKLVENIVSLFEGLRRNLATAYWKTGRWIVEEEQKGAVRPRRGAGSLAKLSSRLTRKLGTGFSVSNLTGMRRFYLENRYSQPAANMSLSHQLELLRIEDAGTRKALGKRVEREGLSRADLRALIRAGKKGAENKKRSVDRTPLVPKRGIPDTYRVKSAEEIGWPVRVVLFLDNGFRSYKALTPQEAKGFRTGDIVEISGTKLVKSARTERDLYTYPAYFTKGIDGDTFWMTLDRGRGDAALQKLRLRGIDCPEINTPSATKHWTDPSSGGEGQAAKRFAESVLKAAVSITVCSSKNDNHDRYEADVFFTDKNGKQIYLNNLLLEKGHAVRMAS